MGEKTGRGGSALENKSRIWEGNGLEGVEVFKLSDPESLSTEPKIKWQDGHTIYDSLKVNRAQVRNCSEKPSLRFLWGDLERSHNYGREVEPAPADDLEIGKVGLPQLVHRRGLVTELISRRHHSK